MNRGARREPILASDGHAVLFLDCVGRMAERFGVEVHAYVVMSNHYHLLLRSVRGNLSRAMQYLGGEFTRRVNRSHGWDGPVFRGRFHNQVVHTGRHLMTAVEYIHLNPCKAGLVTLPTDYLNSSHAAYVDRATPPPWLHRKEILRVFGTRAEYKAAIESRRTGHQPWQVKLEPSTGFFFGRTSRTSEELARLPGADRSAEELLHLISAVTSSTHEEICAPGNGRNANPRRRLAVWALRRHGGLTHPRIAALLDMTPIAVAHVLSRINRTRSPPDPLGSWMCDIDVRLKKW